MPTEAELDAITIEQLRAAAAGEKWTRHPGCIGAFVAEMDFGTAPPVASALRDAIDRAAFGYLPEPLAAELAAACAAWHRDRYGWELAPERIRPVADVLKAAEIAITLFSPPGSPVILPTPAYMPFLALPAYLGRELIQVPMLGGGAEPWRFDLEGLDRALAAGGADRGDGAAGTLILCNPANPLGRVFRRDELAAVAALVERHGGRVFADEIHAPLVFRHGDGEANGPGEDDAPRHLPYASLSAATAAHTLTATSASKAWNVPGLKCAQLLFSNREDLHRWQERGGFAGYGASTLGVAANAAAYREGGPWLSEILAYLEGNRDRFAELVTELIPDVRHRPPEGTYLAWLDFRETALARPGGPAAPEADPGGLAEHFRRAAGVATVDGSACGTAGIGALRFNFALPRPLLERAVQRLAEAAKP